MSSYQKKTIFQRKKYSKLSLKCGTVTHYGSILMEMYWQEKAWNVTILKFDFVPSKTNYIQKKKKWYPFTKTSLHENF